MKQGLRQRLIGALVLLAVGLIVWPLIFDSEPIQKMNLQSEIPQPPAFARFDVPKQELAITRAPITDQLPEKLEAPQLQPELESKPEPELEPAPAPEPKPVAADAGPVDKPALDDKGMPVLWAVQLGSFSERLKARTLVQQLQDKKYKAFTVDVTTQKGNFTRVYIGPAMTRQAAEEIRQGLDKSLADKAYVVRYHP